MSRSAGLSAPTAATSAGYQIVRSQIVSGMLHSGKIDFNANKPPAFDQQAQAASPSGQSGTTHRHQLIPHYPGIRNGRHAKALAALLDGDTIKVERTERLVRMIARFCPLQQAD